MSCISRPNEDAQKSFILTAAPPPPAPLPLKGQHLSSEANVTCFKLIFISLALGDDDQEAFLRALPFLLVQLHKCSAELPKVKLY